MMKKWFWGLLAAALLSGCASNADNTQTADDIAQALDTQGLTGTVERTAQSRMQTLIGTPYSYTTESGEQIGVFVYEDADAAQDDAACVSADGFGYNREDADGAGYNVQTGWADAPHFYRRDNIILRYIGSDADVLKGLEAICGAQFAGSDGK